MRAMKFHEVYRGLLHDVKSGPVETNARTGVRVKLVQGGHSFKLSLDDGKIPVAGNRKYYPHVAAAEVAWQFMGTKDPTFILSMAPRLWSKFVEDGELKTAYGYRWRKHFGRDQLQLALNELSNNPTNRQLWVQAWDPAADGLGGPQPKNVPCPIGFTLSRHNDDVHMNVFMRSSDVFVGLPYDVMAYALTLDCIAASLGCRPASLHFTLAHAHLYEPHWRDTDLCLGVNAARGNDRSLSVWSSDCAPSLPGWSVADVIKDPHGYVQVVRNLSKRTPGNSWDPVPELVE